MEPAFASINADCACLIFQWLKAHDIARLADSGCSAMRQRIFTSVATLHIPFEPERRISFPSSFITGFKTLKTLILGKSHADGPYVPGIDITVLPSTLTHLELNIANGTLALLKLSSNSLNVLSHGTSCHPLKTMLPHLQHLHLVNGYRLDHDPFPGLDLLDELSQLPLLTLTYAPLYTSFASLNKLPTTLVGLKIDCTNWKTEGVGANVSWPKSLKSLEILNIDEFVLLSFDTASLPTGLERLRIELDDFKAGKTHNQFKLDSLPSSLTSLHIRHLALILPKTVLEKLPTQLDELRLYILSLSDDLKSPSVYELMPRSLRTLHLFCVTGSPHQGAYYDHLPRGLVDFCCDRPFGLTMAPSLATASNSSAAPSTAVASRFAKRAAPLLANLPSSLVRSRSTPPNDCPPDELLSLHLRRYGPTTIEFASSAPSSGVTIGEGAGMVEVAEEVSPLRFPVSITDLDVTVDSPFMELEERLYNAKRLNILASGTDTLSNSNLKFLANLNVSALELSCTGNTQAITHLINMNLPQPLELFSIALDHGMDGFQHPDWSGLRNRSFPLFNTLRFPLYWYTRAAKYLPPTLTELELVRPAQWMKEESFTTVIETLGRPLELFKSLPPTLLRLRCAFPYLFEGNIFALLPRKLQELHLHGNRAVWDEVTSPNIPVDQLFHLPISLTRLTLPRYNKESEGVRIFSVHDTELLQIFFAERPQLRSFGIWCENYAKHVMRLVPPNDSSINKDWVLRSYNAPSQVSHMAKHFHPASSLEIAVRSSLLESFARDTSFRTEPSSGPSSSSVSHRNTESRESPSPSSTQESKKVEKSKGGGLFSRLFGRSTDVAQPSEAPVSTASSSEPASTSRSFVYREPEGEKTKYKPQLDFDTITSMVSSNLNFAPVSDSATSTDNGYAEFWANETLARIQAKKDKRDEKEKKRREKNKF